MQSHPFLGPMVVFDIETLSVDRRALVYEVAAIRVQLHPTQGKLKVLEEAQWFLHGRDQEGRHVLPDTLVWMDQTPGRFAALAQARKEGTSVAKMAQGLGEIFRDQALGWCRGTHFDMVILEDLFADHEVSPPWRYDQILDLRTLDRCLSFSGLEAAEVSMAHDSLEDCRLELPGLEKALGFLRSGPKGLSF